MDHVVEGFLCIILKATDATEDLKKSGMHFFFRVSHQIDHLVISYIRV